MWSKSPVYATAISVVGAIAIAVSATWGTAPVHSDGKAVAPVVDRLAKEKRTGFIREKVKGYGELILSPDYDRRKTAIDFFHDVRAPHVILLAVQEGSYDIRNYAAKALCEVACAGDAYVVEKLLDGLGDTTRLFSGGTEQQYACLEYRVTVVKSLERLTGVQLVEEKHRNVPIVALPNAELTGGIPDADVPEIERTVKKWLESKSPKGDAPRNSNASPGAM